MSSQLVNKNPTFKNVIDYLKNTPIIEEADTSGKIYGRKNGVWSEITQGGGGGGEATNIGDNVYTLNNDLIIEASSTQIETFFNNLAPIFDDTVSYPIGQVVVKDKVLYTLPEGYNPSVAWDYTSHTTAIFSELLNAKADINYVDKIAKVYIKTIPNFNGTQTTFNYSFVTNTMVPINMDLSNPKAQNGNWTITTNNGSITIQGNVTSNESTNITLYLMESIDKDSN